jgi:hypothetical protein
MAALAAGAGAGTAVEAGAPSPEGAACAFGTRRTGAFFATGTDTGPSPSVGGSGGVFGGAGRRGKWVRVAGRRDANVIVSARAGAAGPGANRTSRRRVDHRGDRGAAPWAGVGVALRIERPRAGHAGPA